MRTGGTASKTGDELDDELEGMGASVDWTAAEGTARAPRRAAVSGFDNPAPKVYLVRRPDLNQATVIMGHLGIERRPGDADYPAAVVANSILGGGGFASRLMQHVRTDMGLAYGCRSRLDAAFGHQGTFLMQGQTKSGSTLAMARAMRKELERIAAEPPTAEELRVAKNAVLEGLVFSSDKKSEVLDRALRNDFYGFPQNELEIFQQGIAAVTAEDCLRIAKGLFRPDRLITLIVGDDADFDGKVEELGEVTTIDVTLPDFGGRPRRRARDGGE